MQDIIEQKKLLKSIMRTTFSWLIRLHTSGDLNTIDNIWEIIKKNSKEESLQQVQLEEWIVQHLRNSEIEML